MENLIKIIKDQFKLGLNGDHGLKHWQHVEKIGNYLASHTGADGQIISLFAYLHDSKREDEYDDPEHGKRSANFAKELHDKKLLSISKKQFHSQPNTKSNDVTIQTCWDADRLDLVRLGITPKNEFLFTEKAKKKEAILFAIELNKSYPQQIS